MGELTCRIAQSDDDRQKIFELRYTIYIEEMARSARYVDHTRKVIIEPYDATATLYGAFDAGNCVATVRANWLSEAVMRDYVELYRADTTEPEFSQSVATTKVMLARSWRRSIAASEFFKFVATDLLRKGARYNYCDANDPALGFFHRLGHKAWGSGKVVHPDYGEVTVLRMDLFDIAYLTEVRSPLAELARAYASRETRR